MKKRRILLTALLCVTLTGGCAKTPEEPIVKKKSTQNLENYKEAEEPETLKAEEPVEPGGLAKRLGAPEYYENSIESTDGNIKLDCNANVQVPDANQVGIYKVSQLPFDEEMIQRITEGFFGDSRIYNSEKYLMKTKEQALEKLEELKQYQAEGNLDPYGYIKMQEESERNYEGWGVYSLQNEIDEWESLYENAPETIDKFEMIPELTEENRYHFIGVAECEDANYYYALQSGASDHMSVEVTKLYDEAYEGQWFNNEGYNHYTQEGTSADYGLTISQEKAEKKAGITPEEAEKIANSYMKRLGLTDFTVKNIELTAKVYDDIVNNLMLTTDAGYRISYTRNINGFPITYERGEGGFLESMESTQKTWGYEVVEFVVNKDGLQYARIKNLYQIEEKQMENLELKSFPEIAGIFEQMLPIEYASMSDEYHFSIQDVSLGYMRIYDPGVDFTSGLLVPVWDFFGYREDLEVIDGEERSFWNDRKNISYMTINAADGTIISRSLGY